MNVVLDAADLQQSTPAINRRATIARSLRDRKGDSLEEARDKYSLANERLLGDGQRHDYLHIAYDGPPATIDRPPLPPVISC